MDFELHVIAWSNNAVSFVLRENKFRVFCETKSLCDNSLAGMAARSLRPLRVSSSFLACWRLIRKRLPPYENETSRASPPTPLLHIRILCSFGGCLPRSADCLPMPSAISCQPSSQLAGLTTLRHSYIRSSWLRSFHHMRADNFLGQQKTHYYYWIVILYRFTIKFFIKQNGKRKYYFNMNCLKRLIKSE